MCFHVNPHHKNRQPLYCPSLLACRVAATGILAMAIAGYLGTDAKPVKLSRALADTKVEMLGTKKHEVFCSCPNLSDNKFLMSSLEQSAPESVFETARVGPVRLISNFE